VTIDGVGVGCIRDPRPPYDLGHALRAACPAPFAALGAALETEGIRAAVERWALDAAPPLAIPTDAVAEWSPMTPAEEAIGQGSLTVTPLQMALAAATLTNNGITPTPRLTLRVESPQGPWREVRPEDTPRATLPLSVAQALRAQWATYEHNVQGHLSVAVAGEERPPHAWFIATSVTGRSPYAIAVLIEHPEDPQKAEEIGLTILEAARLR
jgi:peptidoglycan glycosyltransferase